MRNKDAKFYSFFCCFQWWTQGWGGGGGGKLSSVWHEHQNVFEKFKNKISHEIPQVFPSKGIQKRKYWNSPNKISDSVTWHPSFDQVMTGGGVQPRWGAGPPRQRQGRHVHDWAFSRARPFFHINCKQRSPGEIQRVSYARRQFVTNRFWVKETREITDHKIWRVSSLSSFSSTFLSSDWTDVPEVSGCAILMTPPNSEQTRRHWLFTGLVVPSNVET